MLLGRWRERLGFERDLTVSQSQWTEKEQWEHSAMLEPSLPSMLAISGCLNVRDAALRWEDGDESALGVQR